MVCDLKKEWELPGNEKGEERPKQREGYEQGSCGRRKSGSFMEARPLGLEQREE